MTRDREHIRSIVHKCVQSCPLLMSTIGVSSSAVTFVLAFMLKSNGHCYADADFMVGSGPGSSGAFLSSGSCHLRVSRTVAYATECQRS